MRSAGAISLPIVPFLIGSALVHGVALVAMPGPASTSPELDLAASRPLRTTVTLPEPPPETTEAPLEPRPDDWSPRRRRSAEPPPPPRPSAPATSAATPTPRSTRTFEALPPPYEPPPPSREPTTSPVERSTPRPLDVPLREDPPAVVPEDAAEAAVDVEPKPDAARCPEPEYPLAARRRGWQGVCTVLVVVDAEGRPTHVSLHESSGRDVLDRAALEAVRGWWFEPAERGGRAVEGRVRVPVRFSLRDR